MVQDHGSVGLYGVKAVFDDERVVSDAGMALIATLARIKETLYETTLASLRAPTVG